MIECLNDDITCVRSKNLQMQLSTIEKSANGTIKSSSYSDLFMASCFCAYTRRKKAVEIMPLIEFSNEQITNKFLTDVKTIADIMNIPKQIKHQEDRDSGISLYGDSYGDGSYEEDVASDFFLPFFNE